MELLNEILGDRIISKNGIILWPPRSPDLNACDFFLWGHLKQKLYRTEMNDIEELKFRIQKEIADIKPDKLQKVFENFKNKLKFVWRYGKHKTDVIFKSK